MDNDIIFKGACYGLLSTLLAALPGDAPSTGVLGAARFVISKKLSKRPPACGEEAARKELEAAWKSLIEIEPSQQEISLAANLETMAQQLGVDLDVGESLLCAVVMVRALNYLVTGDKRAIVAISRLAHRDSTAAQALSGRVLCLEQMFMRLLAQNHVDAIRTKVCAEKQVDVVLALCFSCSSAATTTESICEGLSSYVNALRADAPSVLCD